MSKIIGSELKTFPGKRSRRAIHSPVWRYSGNPIIGRHATKRSNSVFNSAVVPALGTALPVSSAVTAVQSAWTFLWALARTAFPGRFRTSPFPLKAIPLSPCESTATIPGYAIWTGSTISPGATATMVPPLAWAGRRTSRPSTSWKMPPYPITATAFSSPEGERPLSDAEPPQRHRPHPIWRHFHQPEPGPEVLGLPPPRDEHG